MNCIIENANNKKSKRFCIYNEFSLLRDSVENNPLIEECIHRSIYKLRIKIKKMYYSVSVLTFYHAIVDCNLEYTCIPEFPAKREQEIYVLALKKNSVCNRIYI